MMKGSDTVKDLKMMIQDEEEIPSDEQRLTTAAGEVLEDDGMISIKYEVKDDNLYLILCALSKSGIILAD